MRSQQGERGQVLPIVALALAALMGFAAFAVDLGYLRYQQRVQQYAADAAAIQAAWQLQTASGSAAQQCGDPNQPGSPAVVCSAGQTAASNNSFTSPSTCSSTTKTCVSVNYPPATGGYSGDNAAVEAIVTVHQPGFFSNIFGIASTTVSTRAVALVRGNANGPCIYTLTQDLVVGAGAQVNAPCGILVGKDFQSTSSQTMNVPSIGTVGHIACGSACTSSTVLAQYILPFADPCPTIPGCVAVTAMFPNLQTPGPTPFPSCSSPSGTTTSLGPGCYTSLNVNDLDLQAGLYVIQGDFTANNVTCSTCVTSGDNQTGVTLVIGGKTNLNGGTTNLQAPPGGQGPDPVTVSQNGGAAGIVVYETGAGNCTNPQNQFAGTLRGMIYAPSCQFNVNASSTLTLDFLVVDQMEANGIVLTVPNNGGQGIPQAPALAE